jgi:hypothetical protein
MIIDLLRSDGSIVVNKKLAHAIGMDAAIMYSELISKQKYFTDHNQLTEDGYFFNTVENMENDTTLSKYQQLKAIKKLVKLKLLFHENRGLPQKRFFKVNGDKRFIKKLLEENISLNRSKKSKQLIGEKVTSNNINLKNYKENNNKTTYLISDENEAFAYYSKKFKSKFGKNHPTMNEEKMGQLISSYDNFSTDFDIDFDTWFELIDYHFEHLSVKNNGNIISFLAPNGGSGCIYRYLEDMDY